MKSLLGLAAIAATLAGQPDAVDRVSAALAQGMKAERANDGRAMLAAARVLEALAARPETPDGDLAVRWREKARARGIVDRDAPNRGRALGPGYRRGVLAPGQELSTQQVFLAGEKAEVALVPEPGRTLAFRIAAPDQRICERAASVPRATCTWVPVFTHRVQIRIANGGTRPATYYLVSN